MNEINTTPFKERYKALVAEYRNDIDALKRQGKTYQEIADILGTSRAAINNHHKGY